MSLAVVIIPTSYGLAVVDFEQLVDGLTAGLEIDEAVSASAIDELAIGDAQHVERIRQLNATGDAGAYWQASR